MVNLKDVKQCPECGSNNIVYNEKLDQIVCKECGDIFSELSPEQEKKFEDASDII